MLDPDDGYVPLPDALHQVHEQSRLLLGQPTCDLVKQQHSGIARERACELQPFSVEQGQLACHAIRFVAQSAILENGATMLISFPRGAASPEHRGDKQILERGHRAIGLRNLVGPSDAPPTAFVWRLAFQFFARVAKRPGVKRRIAADEVEQGCLSGAVRTKHAEHFPRKDVEVDLMKDAERAVGLREAAAAEDRLRHRPRLQVQLMSFSLAWGGMILLAALSTISRSNGHFSPLTH